MALDEVTGGLGLGIDVGSILSGAGNLATGFVIFLIIALATGIITYYFVQKKHYNKEIHVWEEVNGVTAPMFDDKAREIVLPNTSVRAYLLKKMKIYLPRPSKQFGKGHYIFYIRKDGEWVNVLPSNINTDMVTLKLDFDHADMRLSNASIKKLVEKNYKKLNWIKEYAPYIAIGILILMLGITFFLLLNKASIISGQLVSGIKAQGETINALNEILKSLDNLKSSSGIEVVT